MACSISRPCNTETRIVPPCTMMLGTVPSYQALNPGTTRRSVSVDNRSSNLPKFVRSLQTYIMLANGDQSSKPLEASGATVFTPIHDVLRPPSPPLATMCRRAKSYTDFYHVARAHIRKESKKQKEKSKIISETRPDFVLDSQESYLNLSAQLLDASHEKQR